jgi:teichuronic acid biosynthesis glycosyltransferase TuaH
VSEQPEPPLGNAVFAFAYVSWAAANARGMRFAQDRLAARLAAEPRVPRLVLVDPPKWPPGRVREALRGRPGFPLPGRVVHRPLRPTRGEPVSLPALRRQYAALGRSIGRAAARHGLRRPVVITTNPLVAGLAELDWAGPVTFYATDDWTAYGARRDEWSAYHEAYGRIAAAGHRVVAVSAPIIERIAPRGPSLVVPNGIVPEDWPTPTPDPPSWLAELPRPLLVYVGSLDDRVDVEAVRAAADAAGGTVVLVGRLLAPEHYRPLAGDQRIRILPPLPRAEIPALLMAADVGLVPHRRTRLTEAMSPLKLYEYLAAGLPVAASDLEPIRAVHWAVELGDGARGFGAATERAVSAGRLGEHERRAFLAANSWDARHRLLLAHAFG